MKRIVMLIAAVMCLHLTAPSLFAQHLEIEESISQHNIPKRTIESHAESSAGTSYIPKGYRGMVEMAHGAGCYHPSYVCKISSTHGYQFNKYIYLGGYLSLGSAECSFYYDGDVDYSVDTGFNWRLGPDFRFYFLDNKISLFIGFSPGLDVRGGTGNLYLGGQFGARMSLRGKRAVNFAIAVGGFEYGVDLNEVVVKIGYEL